jgi:elongation factor G
MGELHLEVAKERLVSDFKVKAEMGRMRISFKETMRGAGVVSEIPAWEYDREILGKRGRAKVGVTVERLERFEDQEEENTSEGSSSSKMESNKKGKKSQNDASLHMGPEEYDGNEIIVSLAEQSPNTDEAGAIAAAEKAAASGTVIPSGSTDLPIPVLRTSIKNGILSALSRGPLLGYAQTHLKVRLTSLQLYGGDSTPAAISNCVAAAVTEAIRLGGNPSTSDTDNNSVLLEPIMDVRVEVAEKDVGTVIGDISGTRRGRVLSLGQDDESAAQQQEEDETEFQLYAPPDSTYTGTGSASDSSAAAVGTMSDRRSIRAQVPLSSMLGYDAALRALTGGTGKFAMEVIGYGEMDFDRQRDLIKEMRGG